MKIWIQACAVLILASQMTACGGGDSSAAPSSNTEVNTPVQAAPTAAESKALADTYNAAQTLWANTAPTNYHYSYKEGGQGYKFDAYSPVTIWVRDGKISQVISGVQVLRVEDYQQASIEQIFARIAYTLSHSPAQTQFFMEFDPLLGFPSQFKATSSSYAGGTQLVVTDLTIDP